MKFSVDTPDLGRIRTAVQGIVALAWCTAVTFFIGASADYAADIRLLQRAFEGWLPVGGLDRDGSFYTQFHPQAVVDSYGYSFNYVSHLVTQFVSFVVGTGNGVDSELRVVVQNLLVATVGFAGCVVVGRIVRIVTDSPRAEILGFALMAAMPLWSGHSWMNQKDIPFATGFSACVLVAVCGIARSRRGGSGDRFDLSAREEAIWIALGIVLTFGTRPGIAPLAVPLLACVLIDRGGFRRPTLTRVTGVAFGVLFTLATNPASVPNPVGWVVSAVRTGRDFSGWNGDVFFFGKFMSGSDFGRSQLLFEYFFQSPLLLWLGIIGALCAVATQWHRIPPSVVPVAYQAVLVPLVVFTLSKNNYNAGRQFLFVVPGLVTASALGFWYLHRVCRGRLRGLFRAVVVLLCVTLAFDHGTLFPFQYVYRNELFRLIPDFESRFEYDYWAVASREMARRLEDLGPGSVFLGPGKTVDGGRTYIDIGTSTTPFLAEDQTPSQTFDSSTIGVGWSHYWPPSVDVVYRSDLARCREVSTISTVLWPRTISLGSVYDCR